MKRIALPEWRTEAILVEYVEELPQWGDVTNLYLDLETTSGHDKLDSLNPWHNCSVLGIAITADNDPLAYYIPLRHVGPNRFKNLPVKEVLAWLQGVLNRTKNWINHNIKYDANVLANEGLTFPDVSLIDTVTLCKLVSQEDRFSYDLTSILQDWLYRDISSYEHAIKSHLPRGTKDYGRIPIDVMCPYACVDVLAIRQLYPHLLRLLPEESAEIADIERRITRVLYTIERNGLAVDLDLLEKHYNTFPSLLYAITGRLSELTQIEDFRPHVNKDCYTLIVEKYRLPVLERTEKREPSFGESAILAYKAMRPDLTDVWDWILKYKELHKLYTAFVAPFYSMHNEGILHSDYNQLVRTGRMSCRRPNAQQLSVDAKRYVIPRGKGRVIVDIDFSQIEFRLIAHYIRAEPILAAYEKNPYADYHDTVAQMCGIERTPAKRVNFMLAYGGGVSKCISVLASIPSIIGQAKDMEEINAKASAVFAKYHKMLPTLRPTTYQASLTVRQRGYVRTILKRRRYLSHKFQYRAFNSIIQGSAADLFKVAAVNLYEYCTQVPDILFVGCVHDSAVFDMPEEMVEEHVPKLVACMERMPESISLRVPIKANAAWSNKNWGECK